MIRAKTAAGFSTSSEHKSETLTLIQNSDHTSLIAFLESPHSRKCPLRIAWRETSPETDRNRYCLYFPRAVPVTNEKYLDL
jgi:hypothetical protein